MSFESREGGLVRPRAIFLAGLGLAVLVGLGFLASALFAGAAALLGSVVQCAVAGYIAYRYAFYSTKGARLVAGRLSVDDVGTLRFGERVLARRGDLARALVTPTDGALLVQLVRKGARPPIHVRVADDAEAQALLVALGQDAGHAAAQMVIASRVMAMPILKQLAVLLWPYPILIAALPHLAHGALPGAAVAAVLYTALLSLWPTTVRVGTDGVFTSWLGRRRFLAHEGTIGASFFHEVVGGKNYYGVDVVRRDGERVRLATGQGAVGEMQARQLEHRIREAADLRGRGDAGTIARGDRSLPDWLRDLRRLGAGATHHRSAATPPDVLLRIVEDSGATEEARAGAAVAAVTGGDEEARARVRVAAETSASPELRALLADIADGADDDALVPAIEALRR